MRVLPALPAPRIRRLVEGSESLKWLLFLALAGVAAALVWYVYRRRETPGRGRNLLIALRALTLAILILLLIDPQIPVRGRRAGGAGTRVIVDASLSMNLPSGAGRTRWQEAVQRAAATDARGPVLLAGGAPVAVPADSLAAVQPFRGTSRLLPVLQAAAEAGAERAVVITDAAIEDLSELQRWAPRLGMQIDVERVGEVATANRSIAELEPPAWAEAGDSTPVSFGVVATGGASGTVRVIATQNGREIGSTSVSLAPEGRIAGGRLSITPQAPPGGGLVRVDLRLEPGDAVPDDDVRSFYIFVGQRPAGVAVVSLVPDWEPRFLHPVLEKSLGLPVRTFLRTSGDRYLRTATGTEAGATATEQDVRNAVRQADLVVLHGLGAGSPSWAREVAAAARRVLVFPAVQGLPDGLPFAIPAATAADWYVSGNVPPSPIAGLLAGIDGNALSPLQALHIVQLQTGTWVPLYARRGRTGAAVPIVLAGEMPGRRWAVGLGVGYWRWAFRGGAERDAYDRLWGALAGWLANERPEVAAAAIRPARRAIPRATDGVWLAPGTNADSLSLRITGSDGAAVLDTVLAVEADSAILRPLPPGHYQYSATATAEGETRAQASGPFTIESFSPEYIRPARDIDIAEVTSETAAAEGPPGAGRPIRSLIWPYILVVLLLATEWILRRRWGLR